MVTKTQLNLAQRFMATQFPVWGGDGSQHMDRKETAAFPDLSIIPDLGGSFLSWKATQGAGSHGFVDRTFLQAWQLLRKYNEKSGKFIARFPFHFWDYFEGHYTGSPELFGKDQFWMYWKTVQSDPGEIKGYLDVEPYAGWYYINWTNQSHPMQIARGFIKAYSDKLGCLPGIYTSPGMLPFFGDFFKDCDLWLAWYNELRTLKDLQRVMSNCGWRGPLCFWQYASDGDIDEDGIGDGLRLGMEEKNFDLDIWVRGGMDAFSQYCGQSPVAVVSPPEIAQPETVEEVVMQVTNSTGLNIREYPEKSSRSTIVGWMPNNSTFTCVKKVVAGSDVWCELPDGHYAAEIYQRVRYSKPV